MKKWLTEASSDKSKTTNLEDEFRSNSSRSNLQTLQLSSKNRNELNIVEGRNLLAVNMGLGVSSETPPQTCPVNLTSQGDNEIASHRRSSGELSLQRSSVAFITSVNSRIEVSSPCHHFTSPTVSVQLHHPTASCSSSSQNQRLMTVIPSGENSVTVDPPNSRLTASNLSQHHTLATEINHLNIQESLISHNASTSNAISLPLSTFRLPQESESMKPNCNLSSSHMQISSGFSENHTVDSSSESESRPESSSGSCNSGFYGLHHPSSGSDYDISAHASLASSSAHVADSGAHAAGAGGTSVGGCGHWCSACHVRVQVEVECVPSSQRSPSGNRRAGIKTLTLPKKTRPRHKIKAPNKEMNCSHKKKKSPWPFRLNCRLRANKTDDQESSLSALNMGCTSCVCPGYRRPEAESTYRSVVENVSPNNLNAPMVDLSRFNPEAYPINDVEETARLERAREMAEGVEPPPGFRSIPLLGESRNSLGLPLTYNMINLHVLLENSLRFGLGGSRTSGIPYQGESLMHQIGIFASDGSCLSRTVHTQVDYIHCLVPDLLAVTNCGFYWGKMDRYEAERLLENRPEGTFLLRDSAQEEFLFSVSFRRYGRSLHARIEQWNHKFSFDSHDPGVFASDTVCGLIEHYKDPSCCMYFEPLLTNPLARTFPFPLQHLCRAAICSKTTYDGINNLDLPKIFKNYLKEYHYKQRVRVRHLD